MGFHPGHSFLKNFRPSFLYGFRLKAIGEGWPESLSLQETMSQLTACKDIINHSYLLILDKEDRKVRHLPGKGLEKSWSIYSLENEKKTGAFSSQNNGLHQLSIADKSHFVQWKLQVCWKLQFFLTSRLSAAVFRPFSSCAAPFFPIYPFI